MKVYRWFEPHGSAGQSLEDRINAEPGTLVSHAPLECMVGEELGLIHFLVFAEPADGVLVGHFESSLPEHQRMGLPRRSLPVDQIAAMWFNKCLMSDSAVTWDQADESVKEAWRAHVRNVTSGV